MDWIAEHAPIISGLDGIVELSVAILIVLGLRARQGRIPPLAWLAISYFLIESLVSFNHVFVRDDAEGTLSRAVVLEIFGTVVIVLMLANASRIAGVIALLIDEAKYRAYEYERARRDYTQVVRHRIANPLMVIKGQHRPWKAMASMTPHVTNCAWRSSKPPNGSKKSASNPHAKALKSGTARTVSGCRRRAPARLPAAQSRPSVR